MVLIGRETDLSPENRSLVHAARQNASLKSTAFRELHAWVKLRPTMRAAHRSSLSAAAPERKPASADRRAWHLAERQRLDGVMAEGRAEIRRADARLVQEHERGARASARNEATRKTFEGTPSSRAAARKETAIDREVERLRLAHAAAEARAFARKF